MKSYSPFLAIFLLLASCEAQNNVKLDPAAFAEGISKPGVQLLDVRTAEEFKSAHLKNALQANWNDPSEFKTRTEHIDKDKPVYVYCLSGGRSAAAASWLRKEGYTTVFELSSGINGWRSAGLPVESNAGKTQMTLEEYQYRVNSHPVILVDFGAAWCPPCKKMEPILQDLVKQSENRFQLVKVDGGNDIDVMRSQGVEALPVFIIYKNGKEVWRHRGIVSKEELQKNL